MFAAAQTLRSACLRILTSGELEAKLAALPAPGDFVAPEEACVRCLRPARGAALAQGSGAAPLPPAEALGDPAARGLALARFAHHELQAVELFAAAWLRWPGLTPGLRRSLLGVLADEQRHCRLYLERLGALGLRFADFAPHSDYFWKHAHALLEGGPAAFFAAMGLTLEQANLDFTRWYGEAFAAAGDAESARVCALVHDDEARHVALAAHALRELGDPTAGDTARYAAAAPFPFSAARAKGRRFDADARRRAGLDPDFIAHVRDARSPQELAPRAGCALVANLGAEEGSRAARARLAPEPRAAAGLWAALWDEPLAFAWLPRAGLAAWWNDEAAASRARALGLALFGAPPEVARRVHDKAFAWRAACAAGCVPESLRELVAVLGPEELCVPDAAAAIEALVAAWPAWARRAFVLKPRLGSSGRGRAAGRPGDARWQQALPRLAAAGGALLEPWLERSWDASVQLFVPERGEPALLGSLLQTVTPAGVPRGHRGRVDEAGRVSTGLARDAELRAAARTVALAAQRAGYVGPCGVDAFGFRGPDGEEELRPVVELNARFTLGLVTLGHAQRSFAALRAEGRLAGAARFALSLDGELPESADVRVALPAGRATLGFAAAGAPALP